MDCQTAKSSIDMTAVLVAIIASVPTLVIAALTKQQLSQSKLTLGANTIIQFQDKFEAKEFILKRKAAAEKLKVGIYTPELCDILSFF